MKVDVKKLIILNIPYVIVFYMVDKVAWLYRHVNGDLAGMRLVNTFTNFKLAFQNPLPSFHPTDILIGIAGALIMKAVVYYRGKNAKKFRQGVEYGSARWDAYYLLKEVIYGHRRRKHYDPIQQDHRAVLPSFSR